MSAIGELAHGERQKDEGRDNKAGYAFLAPWLIGLVVITVGPMLASLYLSFTNYPLLAAPRFNGIDNYVRMFNDPRLLNSLVVTFTYVIVGLPYFHLGSLKRYLHGSSLSKPQKLQVALALAKCVQQVHQIGWIHGDIKPSNFLLASSQVYLNDWACAQSQFKDLGTNETQSKSRVQGTPAYLAPECWQGESITVQSDLYAFGITLFELWVGEKPYQLQQKELYKQKLSSQWARLHCQQPIPLLPQQWSSLQPVIDKLLAKQTRNRFEKMETVIQELQQVIKTSAEL